MSTAATDGKFSPSLMTIFNTVCRWITAGNSFYISNVHKRNVIENMSEAVPKSEDEFIEKVM